MTWWLVDNALGFYVLLGFAAVALLYLWWANRRRELLIALGVVVGLIGLLWLLTFFIVTDQKQISNILYEMADAVPNKKPEHVIKHLAEDFKYGALNRTVTKEGVRDAILRGVDAYHVTGIYVSQFKFEKLSRNEKYAKVSFPFNVRGRSGDLIGYLRAESEFVLVGETWLMKSIKFYKGFADSDQEMRFVVP